MCPAAQLFFAYAPTFQIAINMGCVTGIYAYDILPAEH